MSEAFMELLHPIKEGTLFCQLPVFLQLSYFRMVVGYLEGGASFSYRFIELFKRVFLGKLEVCKVSHLLDKIQIGFAAGFDKSELAVILHLLKATHDILNAHTAATSGRSHAKYTTGLNCAVY